LPRADDQVDEQPDARRAHEPEHQRPPHHAARVGGTIGRIKGRSSPTTGASGSGLDGAG